MLARGTLVLCLVIVEVSSTHGYVTSLIFGLVTVDSEDIEVARTTIFGHGLPTKQRFTGILGPWRLLRLMKVAPIRTRSRRG